MRFLLPLLLIFSALTSLLLPGCEPKENIFTKEGGLSFSADTVLFDTVFTQVGTVSKRLWVYNRQARAVRVENISLTDPASPYSLIINGDDGPIANGVEIRGKDSLLILVKATLGPDPAANKPFLIEDQLRFRTNGNDQLVRLVAYGQNANFHVLDTLACNEVWTNDKPHVVYGYSLIKPNCTLTIEEGTRVYFHAGSALRIQGALRVNPNLDPGTEEIKPDDPRIVRFAGDRLEPFYNDVPGQWAGLQFEASSRRTNLIRYAEIKNASFGLLIYNPENELHPKVNVANTVVKNISGAGLSFASGGQSFDGGGVLSFSGDFDLSNCLFTNCGEYAILSIGGGVFNLNYCTIANYTPQFQRKTASLRFNNEATTQTATGPFPVVVNIANSIIWGSIEDELAFNHSADYYQNLTIRSSVLRTKEYNVAPGNPEQPGFSEGTNLINVNPKFRRSPENAFDRYDYRLDTLSPALNRAVPLPNYPRDLRNHPRDPSTPDPGAYERLNP